MILTTNSRVLLVVGVIIALILALAAFIVLVSAQNIATNIFSAWNMTDIQNATDSQNGTNTTETKPSESLTLEGLSP
jgi:uncharacterized membrane protein YqhA